MAAILMDDLVPDPPLEGRLSEAGDSEADKDKGISNQEKQLTNGSGVEHGLLDLNSPKLSPPQRAEVNISRGWSVWVCCLSMDRNLTGGAVDCQRAIASETLGFAVGTKMLAHARYEVTNERHTGFRQVRRGIHYTPAFGGPYAKVEFTRDTMESAVDDGRQTSRTETRFGGGVRLPAKGPYADVEYLTARQPESEKSLSTQRVKVGYGTGALDGSYAVAREVERIGNRITRKDDIKTVSATFGGSSLFTKTTRQSRLQPVFSAETASLRESHDAAGETVLPAVETNVAPVTTPESVPAPQIQDAQQDSSVSRSRQSYIAVGILKRKTGLAREKITTRLETRKSHNPLFNSIRKSSWELWPLHKRLFSLKHVSGFGLYHCHVDSGYHSPVEIDDRTRQTLFEFYLDYKHSAAGMDKQWREWTHEHLNNGSADPREGNYALELLLRWSITKIMIYGLLPVVGSLVAGLAYMQIRMREAEDFGSGLAVVQTAWGIASYVIGAAGVTLAILGVITQLADA